jgi:hypothetical protein
MNLTRFFLIIFALLLITGCSDTGGANETKASNSQAIDSLQSALDSIKNKLSAVSSTKEQSAFTKTFALPENILEYLYEKKIINSEYILMDRFEYSQQFNPYYLEGDYNNDGILDIVLSVKSFAGQTGAIVIHGKQSPIETHILGAGVTLGTNPKYIMSDFNAWDYWKNHYEAATEICPNSSKVAAKQGIVLGKYEAGSIYIFWNGKDYDFCQFGD